MLAKLAFAINLIGMTDIRISDLTIGTICRIGITLSTCFWVPVSLLLGIAAATGNLPLSGIHADTWIVRFVAGVLQGIGCSIANDLIILIGAISFRLARRMSLAPDIVLRLRSSRTGQP